MIISPDRESKTDRALFIPKFRKIPLKLVLILPFVALITGAVGLVGYLSYRSGQEAVANLANQLMNQASNRVIDRLDISIKSQQQFLAFSYNTFKQSNLDLNNPQQLQAHFWQQINSSPHLSGMAFANEKGQHTGYRRILSQEMADLTAKITGEKIEIGTVLLEENLSNEPSQRKYSLIDAQGKAQKLAAVINNSDSRTIDWYSAAKNAQRQVWSPVFIFRAAPAIGISAVIPIYDNNKQLLGVWGNATSLSEIGTFLDKLRFSPSGQIFIMERSGKLVATSTSEIPYIKDPRDTLVRLPATQSQNPQTRAIATHLQQKYDSLNKINDSQRFQVVVDGVIIFAQVKPYQDEYGLDWLLITAIPESDFMGEIQANSYWTFLLCGMTLLVATGIGIFTANWISKPINRLSRSSQAIAQENWQSSTPINIEIVEPIPQNHPILEIETLADSVNQMLLQLQESHRQITKDLHQKTLETKGLLSVIPDLMFIHNFEGIFIKQLQTNCDEDVNILEIDITGKHLYDFLPVHVAKMRLYYTNQALQTGEIQTYEQQIEVRGRIQDEEVRVIKISDQEVLTMIRNISDRKKAQKALELQSVIMKNMAEGVCLVKVSDLTIVYTNPKFNAMFGYLEGELIGQPVGILNYIDTHVTPEVSVLDIAAQIDRDGEAEYEVHNKKKDGIPLWCRVHTSRFEHPEYGTVYVAVQQDITELRLAKRELIKAKEAAEAANLGKSIFLANMSHELRTPLNAVMGFSQVMQRTPGLPEEHYKNAGIIYRSGNYLLSLINNILDLSKIEANKTTLNIQAFNLNNLLYDLEEMMNLRAKKSGLILVFEKSSDVPPYICTDEIKLKQVLINLLTNAIKFTRQGTITLRINCLPLGNFQEISQDPSRLILGFSVEDTGVGIAPEELPKIFEAFNQAEAGRNGQEGTGLGLSISRQFVQLMGGEMIVTSELGKGTTFQFQIPVQQGTGVVQPKTENHQRILGLAPDQAEYKILVVDDIEVNRQLLVKILSPLGFQVQEAKNGEEAIELWGSWQPHLIWMDLRMPVMDGYAATKHIKAHSQGGNTIIIALTANVRQDDRAMVLAAGCDDFHTKPFEEQTIFDALSQHLGVSYLYAEESVASLGAEMILTTGDFTAMPLEWVQRVYDACAIGDFDLVTQLTTEIPATSSSFAKSLKELADQFQSEMIMKLIQPLIIP